MVRKSLVKKIKEKIKITKNRRKNGHPEKKTFFNTQKIKAFWFDKYNYLFCFTYSLLLMSKFAL